MESREFSVRNSPEFTAFWKTGKAGSGIWGGQGIRIRGNSEESDFV